MTAASSLPPGLRFPTGSIVGNHLIVSGTFLSSTTSCFAIWALDLGAADGGSGGTTSSSITPSVKATTPLVWQKVDPGIVMSSGGSWNRAVTWKNNVVVLGDRDRDIAADYDHRQTNFVHVAFVDLEVRVTRIPRFNQGENGMRPDNG
jgi:leucine-zipper-like transcriptional regulator 1